jgi:hypothetical protein
VLKNLQRIENCVHNAFEKINYIHKCDMDATFLVAERYKSVQVYCNISNSSPSPYVDIKSFLQVSFFIKSARVYQDVYTCAYNVLTDILRPYFKK